MANEKVIHFHPFWLSDVFWYDYSAIVAQLHMYKLQITLH